MLPVGGELRGVRGSAPPRRRRHGRGVPVSAPAAQPARRGQGAPSAPGQGQRIPWPVPARGDCRWPEYGIRTWYRSIPPTSQMACSTSPWSTCPGTISPRCCAEMGSWVPAGGGAVAAGGRCARRRASRAPRSPRRQTAQPHRLRTRIECESATLVDFGISRMLDEDSQITQTGEIVGTIAYCSPEQLSRRPVTGACDQYSLACVAYECLTGEVPFPREGQLAIMTAHVTTPPPRVTAARADLPPAVDAVLARAMAKDPAARFAGCTEFVDALAAAATGSGSRQHPVFADPAALADAFRCRGVAAAQARDHGTADRLARCSRAGTARCRSGRRSRSPCGPRLGSPRARCGGCWLRP